MQYVGGDIYLSLSDLTGAGVKENTVKLGVHRKSNLWQAVKDNADQRRVLVRWATMGEKYRGMVVRVYGEPALVIAADVLGENLVNASLELEELRGYRVNGKALEVAKLEQYAVACRWLKSVSEWKGRRTWWKGLGYGSAKAVWKAILMVIKAKGVKLSRPEKGLQLKNLY